MKTAWVTGGSSGIGLELTKRLLKDNFQVCIFAHAGIEQAVIDLQKRSPAVCGFEVDVQNESTMEAKFAEATAQFGMPDLLINSAGIAIAKSFEDMTSEEYLRQINI
ncbi:MAG: SDR family NAD(P)-dependent oxidoreductase, partial [Acinetobacter sp.]